MMWCCRKRPTVEPNRNEKSAAGRTVATLSPADSNGLTSLTSGDQKGGNPLHTLHGDESIVGTHQEINGRRHSSSQVATNQSGSNFDASLQLREEDPREVLLTPEKAGDVVSRNSTNGKVSVAQEPPPYHSDPCLDVSPKRKEVRICLPDCIAIPGSFHKAPVGSSVKVLFNKEWRPGVVMALHSDGTSDVATNATAGLLRNIACTSVKIADETVPSKMLQGRWYDQSKATWDVANKSAKCVTDSVTTLHQLYDNAGIITREGSKLVLITEQLCSWDNGDTWRRAPAREVDVKSAELLSISWRTKPMGLEISNPGKCSKFLKEKELLHSINNISVSTAEQVSAIAVSCKKSTGTVSLLVCPKLPHNPIPAPYVDISNISRGDTIEALWGGKYHQAKVIGRTSADNFVVVWHFDDLSWTINQLGIRTSGVVTDEMAEEVVTVWKEGKDSFLELVRIAGDGTSIARHELLKALQVSTATGKQELRYLDSQTDQITQTEWLVWIGRLCEISIDVAKDRITWIRSNTSDTQSPLPIPTSEISSRPGSSFKLLRNNLNTSLRRVPTFVNGSPCKVTSPVHIDVNASPSSLNNGITDPADQGPRIEECVLLEPGRGKVVGETGSLVRSGASLESPVAGNLTTNALIDVVEIRGRRARIAAPLCGWVSVTTAIGETLVCEDPPCPTDNQIVLLKRPDESFDFICHGSHLVQVPEGSPGSRCKLSSFLGMAIVALDDLPFSQEALADTLSSEATTLKITFEEIKRRTITIRKYPKETIGLSFTPTTPPVLESVLEDSPAGSDIHSAIGLQLTHINARPVSTDIQVPVLCSGETRVSLTFRDPTDAAVQQTIDDYLSSSRTSGGFMEAEPTETCDSSSSDSGDAHPF
eukprot:TRINITY_DN4103_c0_g1_i2.p1 TRINITY_DN4103_c0_g1~~TRINITY_DN4103_c0_g1_i2.p1  ORF type:complete len:878 (+),score=159.74 TRINITY_DN4103_c0_g1_i2:75-2708(+)